jgi:molybdenum cofactor biosynthesis enzyme
VHSENSEVNLSFNIGYVRTEVFLEIQVPEYAKPACDTLALYRLSIALFTLYEMYKFLDIWLLNENEVLNQETRC